MNELKSEARSEVIGRVSSEPRLDRTSSGIRVCRFQVTTASGPASNPVTKDIYVIGRAGAAQAEDLPVRCAALEVGEPVVVPGIERQRRRKTRGVNWVESAIEAIEVHSWDAPDEEVESVRRDETIRVVHCMRDDYDVYIGRGKDPNSLEWGEWGNPYSSKAGGRATVTRANSVEDAIESYKKNLWRRLKEGELSLERLAALKDKTLGCWCAPGPCHGEVLVAAAEWAAGRLVTRTGAGA